MMDVDSDVMWNGEKILIYIKHLHSTKSGL